MIRKNIIILLVSIFLFDCNQRKTDKLEQDITIKSRDEQTFDNAEEDTISGKKTEESEEESNMLEQVNEERFVYCNSNRLEFKEIVLILDDNETWSILKNLDRDNEDTLIVSLDLGQSIYDQTIEIEQKSEGVVTVYQRYENSITIMDEGPHCDLIDWKHYYSDWEQLKINDNQFKINSFSLEDSKKFIEIDMNDLRKVVQKHCGNTLNLLKT